MMNRILLGITLGLAIGTPITKYASYDSPYDIARTNVYYDLAVLYGDANKDGHVSDEEYRNFDIDSITPQGKLGEETSYKYLGTLPNGVNQLYLYLYSADRIDDCQLNENKIYGYKSCTYSYSFDYYNASEIKDDGTGYENDVIKTSQLDLINFYSGSKGYYYKFTIPNYVAIESSEETYRFKPRTLRVLTPDSVSDKTYDFGTDNEYELLYDNNCKEENALFNYYSEDTYELEAVQDLWLAPTHSEAYEASGASTIFYFLHTKQDEKLNEAKEIFYVFFNFKDETFKPDEIKEVYWHTNVLDYTAFTYTLGSVMGDISKSPDPSVYRDTYSNISKISYTLHDILGQEYTYTSYAEDGSSYSLNGVTKNEVVTFEEHFDNDTLWAHNTITKKYSVPMIVDIQNIDSYSPDEDASEDEKESWEAFKQFVTSDDHINYKFAYAIEADSLVRSIDEEPQVVRAFPDGGTGSTTVFIKTTECHELYGTVTLGMKVVQNNKVFDIRTIHDPLTTRNAYLIGMPAPSLWDFITNDIVQFFKQYSWVFLIVALVVLVILAMIFEPVLKVITWIFKGLLFIVELGIDIVYVLLVWWWLAIIKKAQGEEAPSIWLFSKKK